MRMFLCHISSLILEVKDVIDLLKLDHILDGKADVYIHWDVSLGVLVIAEQNVYASACQ